MQLIPVSFNGYNINDWNGSVGEWACLFPVGERAKLNSQAVYSPVAYSFPKLSVTQIGGHEITVMFVAKSAIHTLSYLREQLKGWFNIKDLTPHQFICKDTEDANRQWYLSGIPISIQQVTTSQFTVTLTLNDPIWRVVTTSTTGNVSINASPNTQNLTVLGNTPAQPIIQITPTVLRTGSFGTKVYIQIYNPTKNAFPFPVSTVDITNGGLNTAALVTGGQMLASGDDARVYVDGAEVNRWVGTGTAGWNATGTKIWCNIPHSAGKIGTLLTALPNNGLAVTVTFQKTAANLAVLKGLATVTNTAFLINTEIFTFSRQNVDLVNYQITNCQRAQKGTAFAAHSTGATITWIEHDVWFLYNNPAATPPDIDNTQMPLIDLTNSTNAVWVYANFYDTTSARPAAWTPVVVSSISNALSKSLLTTYYTGSIGAFVNPSTELGMEMQTYIYNGVIKAESAFLHWGIYHPAGFTNVSMAGTKQASDLSLWPRIAGLMKSLDSKNFIQVWNELVPAAINTPTAFTHNAVALAGTYFYLQLWFQGSIAAKANNIAYLQGDTVSLTLGTGILSVTYGTPQNNYQVTATITNNTSGESIIINATLTLNMTLTIDCGAKTVVASDGSNMFNAVTLSPNRINADWLNIGQDTNNKFVGTAQLVYTETGIGTETLNYSWKDSSY